MLHAVLPIPWWRLLGVGVSLAVLLAIGRALDLRIGRMALTSSLRGTVQLILVGYYLGVLFAVPRLELVVATFLIMLGVAARTGVGRLRRKLPGLGWLATFALGAGTSLGIVFMTAVIVRPAPWYDPQYVIPFGGML